MTHQTLAYGCTKGSYLSLHTQFVLSFNKPRQSYYVNPILWSILKALFCSWLYVNPSNQLQYILSIYTTQHVEHVSNSTITETLTVFMTSLFRADINTHTSHSSIQLHHQVCLKCPPFAQKCFVLFHTFYRFLICISYIM